MGKRNFIEVSNEDSDWETPGRKACAPKNSKKRIFADMGAIWEKTSRYVGRIPTIQLQNGDFKGFFGNTLSLSPNG
jgi:hypothetical protein